MMSALRPEGTEPPSPIVHVLATVTVQDKVRLLELAEPLLEASRREKGCLLYELMQNNEDPYRFVFMAQWSCPEALNAHFLSPHMDEFLTGLKEIDVFRTFEIQKYSLVEKF